MSRKDAASFRSVSRARLSVSRMPCRPRVSAGWLTTDWTVSRVLVAAWLETGPGHSTRIRTARRDTTHDDNERQELMFIIGVDPHRGSHLAVVLDDHEQ